jgi:hypothetical protein
VSRLSFVSVKNSRKRSSITIRLPSLGVAVVGQPFFASDRNRPWDRVVFVKRRAPIFRNLPVSSLSRWLLPENGAGSDTTSGEVMSATSLKGV